MPAPVLLLILDGWGVRAMREGNALALAKTPRHDTWLRQYERSILQSSGEAVGLVPGQMGNSEVGHLNLGAGRVVYQDISRIDRAIADGSLARHPALQAALTRVRAEARNLHLIGLLGPGGVHSHQRHLHALLAIAADAGVSPVLHVITDGRDTPPDGSRSYLADLEDAIQATGAGQIATVSGRYFAMDRDRRWGRTQKAFDAMVHRRGLRAESAAAALQAAGKRGESDEFITATVIGNENHVIQDGDGLLFYNFRADRMRQLLQAFTADSADGDFKFLPPADLDLLTFTQYMSGTSATALFPVEQLTNTLAEWLSAKGRSQYHSAETEKYPHVTFFFNGRREEPWPGESRVIIPSPQVSTYDLAPAMSAPALTRATLNRLESGEDDFLLVNFANPDMVGHTGSLSAAIAAVECVDDCAGQLVDAVLAKGGVAVVTADHGNCERMIDLRSGGPHTWHTRGPVSLFVIDDVYRELRDCGILADVAPTILELLGIESPPEMSGQSLLQS
ncbi:MAG: 2,3-bisphosphoglycerate-independent phosphoglycerate mutase [Anaerolineaceae bacterium]|nr:2,3-bisphosphoglycerate-independent phosphoglycerate mutase [Anaerolineaceae bacterium]